MRHSLISFFLVKAAVKRASYPLRSLVNAIREIVSGYAEYTPRTCAQAS
jgi:hypothetical protein